VFEPLANPLRRLGILTTGPYFWVTPLVLRKLTSLGKSLCSRTPEHYWRRFWCWV